MGLILRVQSTGEALVIRHWEQRIAVERRDGVRFRLLETARVGPPLSASGILVNPVLV